MIMAGKRKKQLATIQRMPSGRRWRSSREETEVRVFVGKMARPQDGQTLVPGASELPQWSQNKAAPPEGVYCSTGLQEESSIWRGDARSLAYGIPAFVLQEAL
jgi:hypothetical protein